MNLTIWHTYYGHNAYVLVNTIYVKHVSNYSCVNRNDCAFVKTCMFLFSMELNKFWSHNTMSVNHWFFALDKKKKTSQNDYSSDPNKHVHTPIYSHARMHFSHNLQDLKFFPQKGKQNIHTVMPATLRQGINVGPGN